MRLVPRVRIPERRPLTAALLVSGLLARPAAAEDFTGFYAGINAGYGRSLGSGGRAEERSPSGVAPGASSALPPSAARAAGSNPAMRGTGRRPER
ncbi:MAG: hypothetical protein PGN34_12300 [Methylobacterium frigidaeris]